MTIRIDSPDLEKFARDLKASPKEIQREVYREINSATKDFRDEIRKSALETLPSRGGLARLVANSNIRANVSRGKSFRVTISVKPRKGSSFGGWEMDKGIVRHRTYGRGPLIKQGISAGWFSTVWLEFGDEAARRVGDAVMKILRRVG